MEDGKPAESKLSPRTESQGDCGVCCHAFTDVVRRCTACPYCRFPACMLCVQRHLLSSLADPRCMAPDCHKAWPRDYLDASLPRAWINTKFRDHRRAVLLDRERSLLPATAPIAARVRAYERDAQAVHDALDRYRRLLDELDRCRGRVGDLTVDLLGRDLMFNGRGTGPCLLYTSPSPPPERGQ